jgi:hypothetical protein
MTQRVGELLSLFALDMFAWQSVESVARALNWAELYQFKKCLRQIRH